MPRINLYREELEQLGTEAMTKDERIIELLETLTRNQMNHEANEVFELCTYVDGLEKKLDAMSVELSGIRQELKAVRENTIPNHIREQMHVVSSHLKEQCQIMKNEICDIKERITSKAAEINMAFRKKGRDALFKIAEVTHLKPKLISLRNRVIGATEDVKDTIDRIYELGSQVRMANQNKANAFRTFMGKDQVDYSLKRGITMAEVLAKPWEVRRDLLENMSRHLTGAIENVTSLESHVMSERAEKEVTPLAEMAVVAEDKTMYDPQKSVTDISEIPVETEIEEVGKSR
ncbi:MAG: DUF6674 family protein [Butyribacter sp.]|nr:DUF6674 family protein [Butyribacter sp.]